MLQFPAFMTQYPWSTRTIPSSYLLTGQWPDPPSDELLLSMEESNYKEKYNKPLEEAAKPKHVLRAKAFGIDTICVYQYVHRELGGREGVVVTRSYRVGYAPRCDEIRKIDTSLVVIGKTKVDIDKEDDNDDDDDDADHVEESDGDDFEQETG